jgi:hypothetical protein
MQLPARQSPDWPMQNDALSLLKEIGAEKELDTVQKVASSDPDGLVMESAKRAVAAIKARSK